MDYIIYLVIIAFIIILSQISLFISRQLDIEGTVIVPLIVGMILNALFTKDHLSINISELNPIFLTIAGLSFIYVIFDSTAKVGIKNIDTSYSSAFKLFLTTFILNLFILTFIIMTLTGVDILFALIFSIAFSSTSPLFFNDWKTKLKEVLINESIIAAPVLLMLGYIIYDIISLDKGVINFFSEPLKPYLLEIIIGIGVGILIGIIFFNTIRRIYKNKASTTLTLLTILIAYLSSEFLGGDGIISSAVFALFFGNMHVINKEKTTAFLEKIITPLYIIIILILGFTIGINFSFKIFLNSIILLIFILLIRYASVFIVFNKNHSNYERLHLTLNTQHGVSLILIFLLFALRGYTETTELLQLSTLLLIYTGIISSIASYHGHKKQSLEKEQTI